MNLWHGRAQQDLGYEALFLYPFYESRYNTRFTLAFAVFCRRLG